MAVPLSASERQSLCNTRHHDEGTLGAFVRRHESEPLGARVGGARDRLVGCDLSLVCVSLRRGGVLLRRVILLSSNLLLRVVSRVRQLPVPLAV